MRGGAVERAFVCTLGGVSGVQMNCARTLLVRGTARVSEWGGGTVSVRVVLRWYFGCTLDVPPVPIRACVSRPGVCTEGVRGCTWDALDVPSRAWGVGDTSEMRGSVAPHVFPCYFRSPRLR